VKRLNAAVIGLGAVGWKYCRDRKEKTGCHVGAYLNSRRFRLVAVCDINEYKLKSFAKQHVDVSIYTDYCIMFRNEEIDVVSIATPTTSHFQVLYDIVRLESKPKLVFMEKPLAHNLDSAKECVKICRENNVKLAVNFTRRWDDAYIKVRDMINHLTPIHIVGYASREKDFEGNIHMFDVLNWFSNGDWSLCTYIDCHPTDYLVFEIDIIGKEKRIKILENGQRIELYTSIHVEKERLGRLSKLPMPHLVYSFSKAMLNAVDNLAEAAMNGVEPSCSGEKALESQMFYEEWRQKCLKKEPPTI
jgi:predicted dehydrogenase